MFTVAYNFKKLYSRKNYIGEFNSWTTYKKDRRNLSLQTLNPRQPHCPHDSLNPHTILHWHNFYCTIFYDRQTASSRPRLTRITKGKGGRSLPYRKKVKSDKKTSLKIIILSFQLKLASKTQCYKTKEWYYFWGKILNCWRFIISNRKKVMHKKAFN